MPGLVPGSPVETEREEHPLSAILARLHLQRIYNESTTNLQAIANFTFWILAGSSDP
jgi:hypothetical protein